AFDAPLMLLSQILTIEVTSEWEIKNYKLQS
ncbi:MAG: hypothetical protein RLZZ176_2588, partial [Cyanobacteriota bacterium]